MYHSFLTLLLGALIPLALTQSLYITFHGGSGGYNNIGVYSLTGQNLGNLIPTEDNHDSLRGLVINTTDSTVYICSAKDNTLLTTTGCGSGVQVFSNSASLVHPYGVGLDYKLSRVYATNQDGNNVVYFSTEMNSAAVELAAGVTNPRGIAVDPDTSDVYAASEGLQAVLVFDSDGNQKKKN